VHRGVVDPVDLGEIEDGHAALHGLEEKLHGVAGQRTDDACASGAPSPLMMSHPSGFSSSSPSRPAALQSAPAAGALGRHSSPPRRGSARGTTGSSGRRRGTQRAGGCIRSENELPGPAHGRPVVGRGGTRRCWRWRRLNSQRDLSSVLDAVARALEARADRVVAWPPAKPHLGLLRATSAALLASGREPRHLSPADIRDGGRR
jgi:hypothetical protein